MEIIRASTPTDLLAMVPLLVGFEPERSLVCVPFAGSRTLSAALRVDLPTRRREADFRGLAHAVLGMLSRLRGVDGVALVVYSDRTFEDERGIPYLDLARATERTFARAGFRIVESACIAPDGWDSYLERTHRDLGRPLDEITERAALLPAPPPRETADLPSVDADLRTEVERMLSGDFARERAPFDRDDFDALEGESIIELIEGALDVAFDHRRDAVRAAALLHLLVRAPLRDVVLFQWVYGSDVAQRVFEHNMMWLAIQRRTGESMDDLVAREIEEADRDGRQLVDLGSDDSDLFIGRTSRIPDRDRLSRAAGVAARLAALAPPAAVAPTLTVLGWLQWALGRGSLAGKLFNRALEADECYGLAIIMRTVVDAGMLPDWVFAAAGAPLRDARE